MLFAEPEGRALGGAAQSWSTTERLKREFDAVGFFLSGHPLESYGAALKRVGARRWAEFARAVREGETTGKVGAVVLDRFERRTKSGSKIGVFQLSDPTGQFEAIIFQEGLAKYRDDLEKGAEVLLTLHAAVEGEDIRSRILNVEPLLAATAKATKGLRVFVRDETPLVSIGERLKLKGEGEVSLVAMLGPARARSRSSCPAATPSPPPSPRRSRRRPAWLRWSRIERFRERWADWRNGVCRLPSAKNATARRLRRKTRCRFGQDATSASAMTALARPIGEDTSQ